VIPTLNRKYGSLLHLKVPLIGNVVLFTDSKYSRTFYSHKGTSLGAAFEKILGRFSAEGAKVKIDVVPVLAKAFSAERYAFFAKALSLQVNSWFDTKWGKEVRGLNLFLECQRMALAMMARALIGPELTGADQERFISVMLELDTEDRLSHLTRLFKSLLPSGKKETEKLYTEIREMIQSLGENRKASTANQEKDFFNFLLSEFTKDGLTDYSIISSIVFTSVFAGSTNTFATVAWAVVFICNNEKLREEILKDAREYHALMREGKDTSVLMMHGTINTTNLINETIRSCANSMAIRYVTEDIDFGDEFAVPASWFLLFPVRLVRRNEDIHRNPDAFDPHRYETEAKGVCENINFGAGRHPCTGAKFAVIQIKTLLYNLLANYDIQISNTPEELLPANQPIGVFRPARPCLVNVIRKPQDM